MHRRHRLSRSRDFDAVYRQGRSVSTRFLVLYWFAREDGVGGSAARARGAAKAGGAVAATGSSAAARGLARPAGAAARTRLRAGRQAGPAGGGRGARLRLAGRAGRRGARRRRAAVRYAGDRRSSTPTGTRSARSAAGPCKYHPSLLAVRDRRAPGATGWSAARSCSRWRLLRCNPWSHGGVDYASRDQRSLLGDLRQHPHAARGPPHHRPRLPPRGRSVSRGPGRSSALTLIVRILLVPLTVRQIHSMQNLQAHAPEMKEIQRKYKHDRQKLQRGADEVLPGEQDQPGRFVPAVCCAVPDLHRALLRPPGLRGRTMLPDVSGVELGWLGLVPDITANTRTHWSGYAAARRSTR